MDHKCSSFLDGKNKRKFLCGFLPTFWPWLSASATYYFAYFTAVLWSCLIYVSLILFVLLLHSLAIWMHRFPLIPPYLSSWSGAHKGEIAPGSEWMHKLHLRWWCFVVCVRKEHKHRMSLRLKEQLLFTAHLWQKTIQRLQGFCSFSPTWSSIILY